MTPEKANEMNEERALENGTTLAFPLNTGYTQYRGLTKREYMATQIMVGLLSHGQDVNTAVEYSVVAVDRLLIELSKGE